MPLTKKGIRILKNMQRQYGEDRGTRIFYASIRKGKFKNVERKRTTKRYRQHSVRGKSSRGGYRRSLR